MKIFNFFLNFLIILFFNQNLNSIRNPFKFNNQISQEISVNNNINNNYESYNVKYKIIGAGKTGNNTKFIMLENGAKNKIITEGAPEWKLYN